MYDIKISHHAFEQLSALTSQGDSYKKVVKLLHELAVHPYDGEGKPEKLRGHLSGYYTRRINHSERLVYAIDAPNVYVVSIGG